MARIAGWKKGKSNNPLIEFWINTHDDTTLYLYSPKFKFEGKFDGYWKITYQANTYKYDSEAEARQHVSKFQKANSVSKSKSPKIKKMTIAELMRAGFRNFDDLKFISKERRDKEFEFRNKYTSNDNYVRKTTLTNTRIHPMYIEDAKLEGLAKEANDTGFGNSVYQTHFKKLYAIQLWRK